MSDGHELLTNDSPGSLKRCGGIGDLLTGTLGTFTYWTHAAADEKCLDDFQPALLAAYAATSLVRECSRCAFDKFHRSTLADDIIKEIPQQFYTLFDKQSLYNLFIAISFLLDVINKIHLLYYLKKIDFFIIKLNNNKKGYFTNEHNKTQNKATCSVKYAKILTNLRIVYLHYLKTHIKEFEI